MGERDWEKGWEKGWVKKNGMGEGNWDEQIMDDVKGLSRGKEE